MSNARAIRYADPRRSTDTAAADLTADSTADLTTDLAAIAARGRRLHDRAVANVFGALIAGIARAVGNAFTRRGAGRVRARNTGVAIGGC